MISESRMIKLFLAVLAGALVLPALLMAATGDVTAPIHQFIDGFNTGDTKSAYAAYATGDIVIVDEFPPHRWVGPQAAHEWAADYDKHAQATGVSDGTVKRSEERRVGEGGGTRW